MRYVQSHQKIFPTMKNCAILLLLCVLHIACANDELTLEIESDELMKTGSDLEQAETKDTSATEIIKQIRKLNSDGSFTIGFEADDGTFKIETRDSLGNVKQGTYGYIDENGEVKRVSYSTQNNTLFKDYHQTQSTSIKNIAKEEENETIGSSPSSRYNRTFASTSRRPSSLAYLTSTSGTTSVKPSVVQSIPKRRILLADRSTTQSFIETSKKPIEGTTTVVYATSVPTPKPFFSRSTTSPNYSTKKIDKGVEIDQVERKVFIATSKDVTTMKPILSKEKVDEKVDLIKRGNVLRRQTIKASDDEGIEAQQQILYGDGDESSAVYGSFGNVRPLFTTTSQPKIPLQVIAARQRATQLQNILANSSPGTTTEKVYTKIPKRQSKVVMEETKENFSTLDANIETAIPVTQPTEVDERRGQFQRPLPPHLEGLYRPRNYMRQLSQQNVPEESLRQRYGQQPIQNRPPIPQGFTEQQQSSEILGGFNPFFQTRNPYDYDRPLTIRDFERLLQLLIIRQQQQPLRVNPYFPSSNPAAYPPFIPGYNQPYSQIPRPPFFNPLATGLYDPGYQNPYYSPSMPVGQQLSNAIDEMLQQQHQQTSAQDLQKFSRRRQYNSRFFSPQQTQSTTPPVAPSEQEANYNLLQSTGPVYDNYLPPSVREQLLYRMLILALKPEQQQQQHPYLSPSPSASSIHTVLEPEQQEANIKVKSTDSSSKKPVRSVQILGEENE